MVEPVRESRVAPSDLLRQRELLLRCGRRGRRRALGRVGHGAPGRTGRASGRERLGQVHARASRQRTVRTLGGPRERRGHRHPRSDAMLAPSESSSAVVFQNPDDQIVATSVEDDVAFGPENLGLDRAEIRKRVDEALATVGLTGLERREPHLLSGGQKQRLAIAGALAMLPRYLVLDEPTSMLDPQGRTEVLAVLERLRESGHGLLLITQDLVGGAARRQGRRALGRVGGVRGHGRRAASSGPPTSSAGVSNCRTWWYSRPSFVAAGSPCPRIRPTPTSSWRRYAADTLEHRLHVRSGDRASPYPPFATCPSRSRVGELVLVVGATGSGKSTLLRLAAGLLEPQRGHATIDGATLDRRTARGSVGLVFQDAEAQLFADTLVDDVAFGPRNLGHSADEAQAAGARSAGLGWARSAAVRRALAVLALGWRGAQGRHRRRARDAAALPARRRADRRARCAGPLGVAQAAARRP